ncbi:uncharacterized protein LOC110242993 [Exaiptasia diaphana]|uniref:Uncharacterized protein n=1 Tax=Exaiptasia diaphana TaxID=2652724 RepID=A0A913XH56_EXADI|nr:uncharacterized protein LOC110242993 [Exaiptasia diaphana]
MCFWISSNATTPKLVNITVETNMEMSLDVFICRSVWRHICVSFPYGVYVIYVDGVQNKTVYTGNELWKLNGSDIKLSITSSDLINIKLTSLNTWDAFLEEDAILYMSYSCRNHRGNMTIWEEFVKNISMVTSSNTSVIHYNRTSCEGKKGK